MPTPLPHPVLFGPARVNLAVSALEHEKDNYLVFS